MAARRIARGIGRKGFGNARSMRQLFEQVATFAVAAYEARGDLIIVAEDIIGKRPTRKENVALGRILDLVDAMTGLEKPKKFIYSKVNTALSNYDLELNGEDIDLPTLNALFLGISSTCPSNSN